jgi:hypothetical protein
MHRLVGQSVYEADFETQMRLLCSIFYKIHVRKGNPVKETVPGLDYIHTFSADFPKLRTRPRRDDSLYMVLRVR